MAGPLAQMVRAKYPGAYDDMDDAALEAAITSKFPGVYDDLVEQPKAEHPHARLARIVGENLPSIGGAIGGVLGAAGGPLVAAGTAGLGGAAGRLGQRVIEGLKPRNLSSLVTNEQPPSTTAVLGDAAKEGAIQGGLELAGGAVAKGLVKGGERLYRGLLKPAKAVREEFPQVVETLMENRAPISPSGARKIEGLTARSAQQADALIDANQHAAPIRANEIVSEFGDTVKELRKRMDVGQPSELAKVGERGKRIVQADRGIGIPVKRAQELKRTAQNAASAGYRQAERGTVKEVGADTLLDKDVARGFRGAIEKRIPEIASVNRTTQSLMGAGEAVNDAVAREGSNLAFGGAKEALALMGAAGGYGASGGDPQKAIQAGILMRLLATPSTGSRIAIGARELGKLAQPGASQLLRLLMSSHGPE